MVTIELKCDCGVTDTQTFNAMSTALEALKSVMIRKNGAVLCIRCSTKKCNFFTQFPGEDQ